MKQVESNKIRVCVQYDDQPKLMCTGLCALMEHQSLVDLAILCGNNTMHAHKCIMAASSPFFREQLELNPDAEQVVINGMDFATMKSIIEFIYCGETSVLQENLKHVVAAARLFQIRGLMALTSEVGGLSPEESYIPPPIFMNSKPKYSNAVVPVNAPQVLVNQTGSGGTSQNQNVTAFLDTMPLQLVNLDNLVIQGITPLDFDGGTNNHQLLSAIPVEGIHFEVVGNGNGTGIAPNNAITNRHNRQEQQLPLPIGEKCQTIGPNNSSNTIGDISPSINAELDSIIRSLEKRPRMDGDVVQEDDILNEINKVFNTNGQAENVVVPAIMPVNTPHAVQDDSQAILENDMLMNSRIGIGKLDDRQLDLGDEDDCVDFLLQLPN